MEIMYFLIGMGLALCGLLIVCITKKHNRHQRRHNPPALPPRNNMGGTSVVTGPQNRVASNTSGVHSLPPRYGSRSTMAGNGNVRTAAYGPRGIKPEQFPCCPYDKQRNYIGKQQLIFWDGQANCYRCSRGHQFKMNGKII